MNFIKKRKGDESFSEMSIELVRLLGIGIVLLALFAIFSPFFKNVVWPSVQGFFSCWSQGMSCPAEKVLKVIGSG